MTYENSNAICTLACEVERFIKERQYLKGVSPATVEWYRYSFKAFLPVLSVPYQSTTQLKTAIIERIGQLQTEGRGNKNVSINTYLRCLKTFLNWAHEEQILKERLKLSWLKEEEKVLPTFTAEQIKRVLNWRPVSLSQRRLCTLALTAIDTGLRISELLRLTRNDIQLDDFTLRVIGKGNKHRLVPMSVELRKILHRHISRHNFDRVFCTLKGNKLSQRDVLRDFKKACAHLRIDNVRCSFHTLRHTFAVSYLRNGGNLYMLQRILGHSSITTTERYLRSLGIEDIVKEHSSRSLLYL